MRLLVKLARGEKGMEIEICRDREIHREPIMYMFSGL